jgi:CheY-like chemotaxis protein
MLKHVVDVGNCGPDFGTLRRFLEAHFACEVAQCHNLDDARQHLTERPAELVLVNRKLDCDYSDGIEVIRELKADPRFADVPMMLVTNYADHQELAVREGAERGFGKLELSVPDTVRRLGKFLEPRSA